MTAPKLAAAPAGAPHLQTLARSGAVALVGSVVSGILSFGLVLIVTHGLNQSLAGAFFEAVALFTILTNTCELGADTGLVRTVSRYRAIHRTQFIRQLVVIAFAPVLILSSFAAVVVVVWAPQIVKLLFHGGHPELAVPYLRTLGLFIPMGAAASVAIQGTRGFSTIVPYVTLEDVGRPLLQPMLVWGALTLGLGGLAISLAWAVPVGLEFLLASIWLLMLIRSDRRAGREVGPWRPEGHVASEFWRFSAPRGLAAFFQVGILSLDVLLVGGLRTTKEAAVYAAASKLLLGGGFAIEAIRVAIAPQISVLLSRHQRDAAQAVYRAGTWWLIALSFPFYLALAVFGSLILKIFGHGYGTGSTVVLILSLAMLLGLATGNVTTVLLMGGKSSWSLINTVVALALNVGLNLLLIPRLGINGAALAWAVSIVVINIAPLVQVRMLLRLDPFGRGFFVVTTATLVCFGAFGLLVRALLGETMTALLTFGVLATPVYVAILYRYRQTLHFDDIRAGFRRRLQVLSPS